jgi:hypothetical protein
LEEQKDMRQQEEQEERVKKKEKLGAYKGEEVEENAEWKYGVSSQQLTSAW